jgi:hypothetical protein
VLAPDNDGIRIREQKLFPDVDRPRRAPEHSEQQVEIAGTQGIEQRLVGTIQNVDERGRIRRKKLIDRL